MTNVFSEDRDNLTEEKKIVKENEINLSEKGWYYVAAKISE